MLKTRWPLHAQHATPRNTICMCARARYRARGLGRPIQPFNKQCNILHFDNEQDIHTSSKKHYEKGGYDLDLDLLRSPSHTDCMFHIPGRSGLVGRGKKVTVSRPFFPLPYCRLLRYSCGRLLRNRKGWWRRRFMGSKLNNFPWYATVNVSKCKHWCRLSRLKDWRKGPEKRKEGKDTQP